MADGTHISWSDATWQVITGCSVLSPGCTNCYAMRWAGTRGKHLASRKGLTTMTKTGPVWNGKVRFNEELLDQPLRWRKPRLVFVVAHGDLFHEDVPDEWIDKVFAVMALCPRHIFQVLTKRADRMREYMTSIDNNDGWRLDGFRDALIEGNAQKIHEERTGQDPSMWLAVHLPLPNVWLGFSAEDQKHFDARWADVEPLARAGWTTWCSAEPLLGPIDARAALTKVDVHHHPDNDQDHPAVKALVRHAARTLGGEGFLDWIVAGGESSQNKPGRPMHPDWARSLRDQCQAAGVPFHFKQWGDFAPCDSVRDADWIDPSTDINPTCMKRVGARRAGRLLDGRIWDETPGRQP